MLKVAEKKRNVSPRFLFRLQTNSSNKYLNHTKRYWCVAHTLFTIYRVKRATKIGLHASILGGYHARLCVSMFCLTKVIGTSHSLKIVGNVVAQSYNAVMVNWTMLLRGVACQYYYWVPASLVSPLKHKCGYWDNCRLGHAISISLWWCIC